MKKILPLFFALSFVSCTKDTLKPIACDAQKMAVNKIAAVFATTLQCNGLTALETDLNKQLEPLKLCESVTVQSTLADFLCPGATKYILDFGIAKLPAAWECKGGIAAEKLNAVLTDACMNIPFGK